MKHLQEASMDKHPDPHHNTYSKTVFGFWLFLLTDFVLFGTIFAIYIVLGKNAVVSPQSMSLFDLEYALLQTFFMLLSAFFAGLGGAAVHRKDQKRTLMFFGLTFLFSLLFMAFIYTDFHRLIVSGNDWKKNGLLSAFFTLLATHGIHVLLGLIWIPLLLYPVWKEGIGHESIQRLTCLRMLFQFLNIVWIFIYSFVYFTTRGAV